MIGIAAASFPITVLSAALPEIADSLGTSDRTISWVLSAPLLATAVVTTAAGKLGDLYGHRRCYLIGFALSTVMSVLTALAWSAGSLIAFRTLGQALASTTGPSALAMIMKLYPGAGRAPAIGKWSAVSAAAPTIGIVVGGPLVDALSWRAIFVVQAGLAAVAIVAAFIVLPEVEGRRDRGGFDLPGAVTLGAGVLMILLVVNRGPDWGFVDWRSIGGVLLGIVLLRLFYEIQKRAEYPLIPIRLMREPGFALPTVSQFFSNGSYMGSFIITPIMLERLFGYSTTVRALVMLPRPIMFSVASWVGSRQVGRFGVRRIAISGAALIGIGSILTGLAGATGLVLIAVVAFGIAGSGNGSARPALLATVGDAVGDDDLGVGGATFNVMGLIGGAAWITVLTTLVGSSTEARRFLLTYSIAGAGTLVAIALLWRLAVPERSHADGTQ